MQSFGAVRVRLGRAQRVAATRHAAAVKCRGASVVVGGAPTLSVTAALSVVSAASTPAAFADLANAVGADIKDALAPVASLKSELMELLSTLPPGKLTTSSVSETMRLQLVELLPQLERYCVSEPTSSPHLEGTWSVAYVGTPAPGLLPSPTREAALLLYAGGFSPAVFGLAVSEKLPSNVLSVNELTLAISPLQPRATVTADVSAFGRAATVRISSSLEIESASRLLETWSSVDVGNGFTALPAPLQYKRRVFVRFLDDTLAIIRDETGTPTVLTRAGGSEPSTPHPAAAVTATADAAAHKPTSVKAAAEGAGFEPPAAAEEQGFAPEAHTPEVL